MSEAFEDMGYTHSKDAKSFDKRGAFFKSVPDNIIYNGKAYSLDAAVDPQTGNRYIFANGQNGETVQFQQTANGLQIIEES